MLAKFFFRLEVKGRDNIPRTGGFILASNHISYLDPVVLGAACPRQLNFMARHDLFTIPIFGAFIRTVGAFPLRRNFADIASIKEALRNLQQARGLLLFPEGSRTSDGLAEKAKPGIGFIAVKSRLPVVPAFIKGSQKALGRNARFIRPAKIEVYFGKPIYPVRPKRPTEKIKERSNGVYPNNSGLKPVRERSSNGMGPFNGVKNNYEGFARRVIHEIKRLGEKEV